MYIAYSALQTIALTETDKPENQNTELSLRYHAYQSTCHKYSREIAAIQKYLPGWTPAFSIK
jgi:hypothetical protein